MQVFKSPTYSKKMTLVATVQAELCDSLVCDSSGRVGQLALIDVVEEGVAKAGIGRPIAYTSCSTCHGRLLGIYEIDVNI